MTITDLVVRREPTKALQEMESQGATHFFVPKAHDSAGFLWLLDSIEGQTSLSILSVLQKDVLHPITVELSKIQTRRHTVDARTPPVGKWFVLWNYENSITYSGS